VSITAGTTYVASYHTPGYYAADSDYFARAYGNGPLTAAVGAGVYAYGATSTFPSSVYNDNNYWVDILFTPTSGGPTLNGQCGSANGEASTTAPTANLCSAGLASAVSGSGPWNWTCAGSNGGTTASCSAPYTNAANGQCGSASGSITNVAPTANLCTTGTASAVTGSGPWNWTCAGSNGSTTTLCEAFTILTGGLLPSDRNASANWQMAGLQSVGGIPNRTTVCATVSPLGGGQDDTADIQNAVDSCPAGDVVMLTADTFTIGDCHQVFINKAVTVRGAGAGAGGTLVQRTDGASIGVQGGSCPSPHFILGANEFDDSIASTTNLATDAVAGSNTIQVASTSGFSVGQVVLLDESSNYAWQTDWAFGGQVWAQSDRRTSFNGHNPALPNDQAGGQPPNYFCNDGCDRYVEEMKQIASIGPGPCPGIDCTITFDDPVMISYRTSLAAHLGSFTQPVVTYAGLENMTLRNADLSDVRMVVCAYCWVKDVEDTISANGTIWIVAGFRDQVEGVYDHMGAWPTSGGAGYNWTLDEGTSEVLIENSISMLNNKPMVMRKGGNGSVIAYNYVDDAWGFSEGPNIESGINASHWSGTHHALFEGNWSFSADGDGTWGSSPYQTYFRNWLTGYRSKFTDYLNNITYDDINGTPNGCCYPLRTVQLAAYYYWHSFIGNVLGTPGHMNGWIYQSDVFNWPAPAIWSLGGEANDTAYGNGGDPEILSQQSSASSCVSSTGDYCPAIRHGNYDYLNNAVVWDPSNSDHTLPNSFYLTAKPSWWPATYSWPWVTPTGSPQVQTGPTTAACTTNVGGPCSGLPAKARFDNGTPFTQP
jgi:hypothetical protein